MHLSLTVPRGVCRAVLTVSTGFATRIQEEGREGVCPMTAVGQNSWRRSCDGRYYLFCQWFDPNSVPLLSPLPFVRTRSSWPSAASRRVGRQPRITKLGQRPEFTDNRVPIVFPFVLCNICRRVPFARAKVSFAFVHTHTQRERANTFFFRDARRSEEETVVAAAEEAGLRLRLGRLHRLLGSSLECRTKNQRQVSSTANFGRSIIKSSPE